METPNPEPNDFTSAESHTASSYERARASFIKNPISDELRERIISALILVSVFLVLEIIGGIFFTALVLVAALFMMREWDFLTGHYDDKKWTWYGIAYITLPILSLIWLRSLATEEDPHAGMGIVIYLVLVVSAADTGAYFTGRRFGSVKLAPKISPGKTWEGLAGGVVAAGLFGLVAAIFTPFPNTMLQGGIIAMVLAFVSQVGDLFESWLKRKAGVKDSGDLIPGHGGILDRVDGLLAASVVLAFIVLISGYGY